MILLLGGTAETARLADGLLSLGTGVLVSLATEAPLALPADPRLRVRRGRLDVDGCASLIREAGIRLLVDASHPYATAAREMARAAAAACGIPYHAYVRPRGMRDGKDMPEGLSWVEASSHEEAARVACGVGMPILLTIGSRHLGIYVQEAWKRGIPVHARVLPGAEGEVACREAGLARETCIVGRGPFSRSETLALLRERRIGVLVTKDGGRAGGLPEKLRAAREAGCMVVLVARPPVPEGAHASVQDLLREVGACMEGHSGIVGEP